MVISAPGSKIREVRESSAPLAECTGHALVAPEHGGCTPGSGEEPLLGGVGRERTVRSQPDYVAGHLDVADDDHWSHCTPHIHFGRMVMEIDHHDHVATLEQQPAGIVVRHRPTLVEPRVGQVWVS